MLRGSPTIAVQEIGDRLTLRSGDRHLASYIFQGVWKPYFFPLNGPFGNVVRGVNGAEHSNQYGLTIAYGGHGEGGSTNIWSDWDEPPYGPCGKILHEEFLRIEQHADHARVVESLLYIRPDGAAMAHETRDIHFRVLPDHELRVDFCARVDNPRDAGPRPFLFALRVADSMRVLDLRTRQPLEHPGKIRNSEGGVNEEGTSGRPARWCDYSGPVGEGWSGVTLMDHPDNPDQPAVFVSRDYGILTVTHHYPAQLPEHSLCTLQWSAYVHRGSADEARVEEIYQKWASGK